MRSETYYNINIKKKEVLKFICEFDLPYSFDGEQVTINVSTLDDKNKDRYFAKFSGTVLQTSRIDEFKKIPNFNLGLLGARVLSKHLNTQDISIKSIDVHTGNWNDFFMSKSENIENIETECAHCFLLYERENPSHPLHLSAYDIFISLPYEWGKIINAIQNLNINLELLNSENKLRYSITRGKFKEIEEMANKFIEHKNKYYSIVPIEAKDDFVFVIMPFRNKELNSYYKNVIKPTIENNEKSRLYCYRSDEDMRAGIIENKIYTYINRAKLIIAELTENNLNVWYELGLAHALNKEVLILTQNLPEDMPFDISHFNSHRYSNEEQLETILKSCISRTQY